MKKAPFLGRPMSVKDNNQRRLVKGNEVDPREGQSSNFASQPSRYVSSNSMFGIPAITGGQRPNTKPDFLSPAVDPYTFFNSRQTVVDQLPSVKSNWWVTRNRK